MIAIDWGTTHLRAYSLTASGEIEARKTTTKGIMAVAPGGFATVLEEVLADWPDQSDEPILMSGMIGSRQGWVEVPYIECPARLQDLAGAVKHVPAGKRKSALICPGLCCRDRQDVPDVMRGEEVQIFGALSLHAAASTLNVCLPGTHSKHAFIRGGRIERFNSHMTGEVFGLLRDHSIIGRLMTKRRASLDAFDAGLRRARQPGGLLHHVFGVRTLVLMNDLNAAHLTDYLSGILIGHELASAAPELPALLIGDPELCALYQRGLADFGAHADVVSADTATARGLYDLGSLIAEEAQ